MNLHSGGRNPHAFAFLKYKFTEASNGLPLSELKILGALAILRILFVRDLKISPFCIQNRDSESLK